MEGNILDYSTLSCLSTITAMWSMHMLRDSSTKSTFPKPTSMPAEVAFCFHGQLKAKSYVKGTWRHSVKDSHLGLPTQMPLLYDKGVHNMHVHGSLTCPRCQRWYSPRRGYDNIITFDLVFRGIKTLMKTKMKHPIHFARIEWWKTFN